MNVTLKHNFINASTPHKETQVPRQSKGKGDVKFLVSRRTLLPEIGLVLLAVRIN